MKALIAIIVLIGISSCGNQIQHGTIVKKVMQSSGPSYGTPIRFVIILHSTGYQSTTEITEEEYQRVKVGDQY